MSEPDVAIAAISDEICETGECKVAKNFPHYLRLHAESDSSEDASKLQSMCGLEAVCHAFSTTTGWALECRADGESLASARWSRPLGDGVQDIGQLALSPNPSVQNALSLQQVQPLAEAVGHLADEWIKAQSAIWQREAELAAGIPVTLQPEDQRELARRLESVLRGGAEAIGCHAAALYLLDDGTSHLKLRAAWQLAKNRFWQEPRPLRGSVADLEALVGHAVALEDTALLPHWKVPEDYPAALCVPVSTRSTPLGTLWFFSNRVRDFTPEQIHIAEIVSGRLVADLEREVLARESLHQRRSDNTFQALIRWQEELRPHLAPLVEGWQVAGCSGQKNNISDQFYDWCILPDGRIAVALGQAEGPPAEAGLSRVAVQVALRSHAAHPHEARQMLDLLNESLWTHSTGNRFASLFYAMIDPDMGRMQFSSAGQTHSLLCGGRILETLTQDNPQLGTDPDYRYSQETRMIAEGESLAVFSRGHVTALDEELRDPDECRIAELLEQLEEATAEEQVHAMAAELKAASLQQERTVMVVRRISYSA